MSRRLRLHAVDESVGAKLKIHGLAHCDAKRRDEFGMWIADRGYPEVFANDLRSVGHPHGPADEMNPLDLSSRELPADRMRDPLEARPQKGPRPYLYGLVALRDNLEGSISTVTVGRFRH